MASRMFSGPRLSNKYKDHANRDVPKKVHDAIDEPSPLKETRDEIKKARHSRSSQDRVLSKHLDWLSNDEEDEEEEDEKPASFANLRHEYSSKNYRKRKEIEQKRNVLEETKGTATLEYESSGSLGPYLVV